MSSVGKQELELCYSIASGLHIQARSLPGAPFKALQRGDRNGCRCGRDEERKGGRDEERKSKERERERERD